MFSKSPADSRQVLLGKFPRLRFEGSRKRIIPAVEKPKEGDGGYYLQDLLFVEVSPQFGEIRVRHSVRSLTGGLGERKAARSASLNSGLFSYFQTSATLRTGIEREAARFAECATQYWHPADRLTTYIISALRPGSIRPGRATMTAESSERRPGDRDRAP